MTERVIGMGERSDKKEGMIGKVSENDERERERV